MDQVRIGLIGAGGIASRHISDLLSFADVQIIAMADLARLLQAVLAVKPPSGHGQPVPSQAEAAMAANI